MKVQIFQGDVRSGQMAGHAIRVDESWLPSRRSPVYTIVYTDRRYPRRHIIGFADGPDELQAYFRDLRLQVVWQGGRSPLGAQPAARRALGAIGRQYRGSKRKAVTHRRAKGAQDPIKSVVKPYPPTTSQTKSAKAR
jgi:hypothetical protein